MKFQFKIWIYVSKLGSLVLIINHNGQFIHLRNQFMWKKEQMIAVAILFAFLYFRSQITAVKKIKKKKESWISH